MRSPPKQRPAKSARRDADTKHFDRWVNDYGIELYRFAHRLCGDAAAAEDLVQETFHEAWKHRAPLGHVLRPRAWLFLILRRRYAKMQRAVQRRPWSIAAPEMLLAPDRSNGSADLFEENESLQAALNGMSDHLKMPLLMVFVQGLTCAQTAEQLDVPLGTVLSRIHRAKQQLRRAIDRQEFPNARPQSPGPSSIDRQAPRLRIGGA